MKIRVSLHLLTRFYGTRWPINASLSLEGCFIVRSDNIYFSWTFEVSGTHWYQFGTNFYYWL